MNFRQARAALIRCLREGRFDHGYRKDIYQKNWLFAARVDVQNVVKLLQRCRGDQHRKGNQRSPADTDVHEFFPEDKGFAWYIKAYLDSDTDDAVIEAIFLSVHPSNPSS